jgi:hypothetical protein
MKIYRLTLFLLFTFASFVLHAQVKTIQLSIDQTGVEECMSGTTGSSFKPLENIRIYPNPVNDVLSVKISDNEIRGEINTAIFNLLGDVIYNKVSTSTGSNLEYEINLGGQSPGIYFISIQHANKQYFSKIILN